MDDTVKKNIEKEEGSMVKPSKEKEESIKIKPSKEEHIIKDVEIKLDKTMMTMVHERYFRNKSCEEVADKLGYTVGTIYNFFWELRKIITDEIEALIKESGA